MQATGPLTCAPPSRSYDARLYRPLTKPNRTELQLVYGVTKRSLKIWPNATKISTPVYWVRVRVEAASVNSGDEKGACCRSAAIGLGFGENTQALVITRGLSELTRLGMARGANPLTFVGLAGVGDLLAT